MSVRNSVERLSELSRSRALTVIIALLALWVVILGFFLQIHVDIRQISFSLLGTWFLDAFLKRTYNFHNETLFADLSFASLAFTSGQITNFTINNKLEDFNALQNMISLIVILLILWVTNLILSKGLATNEERENNQLRIPFFDVTLSQFFAWVLSIIFALFSLLVTLLARLMGLL